MRDLFAAFLDDPTRERFLAVRQALVADPAYDPYSTDLDDAENLFTEKQYAAAHRRLSDAMPNLLLSPRAHLIASLAARELDDTKAHEFENFVCFRCLDGLLATGDGGEDQPFLVLRTSDIYDVLLHQQKELAQQSLVQKGGRSYDHMTCTDGTELWFDVTDAYERLRQQLGGGGQFSPGDD